MISTQQNKSLIWVTRFADIFETLATVVCLTLGGLMVVVVISGVVARYVVQNPMSWSEEVARFLMNWMALLGVSIVTRHRAHLSVLYFVSMLPIRLQQIIKLVSDCLIMVFLYFLIDYGFKMVGSARTQIETTTGITMNYVLLCVPLCGMLTFVQLGLQMLHDLFQWNCSKSPFDMK